MAKKSAAKTSAREIEQLSDHLERGGADSLCAIPFNVTGLPAMSIPCGFAEAGTPIGMQLATGPFQEELILRVAHAYEQATEWHQRKPKIAVDQR